MCVALFEHTFMCGPQFYSCIFDIHILVPIEKFKVPFISVGNALNPMIAMLVIHLYHWHRKEQLVVTIFCR